MIIKIFKPLTNKLSREYSIYNILIQSQYLHFKNKFTYTSLDDDKNIIIQYQYNSYYDLIHEYSQWFKEKVNLDVIDESEEEEL